MGYTFEFDAANNVLRTTWEGLITDDLLWGIYPAIEKWHAARPPCKAIDDCSRVTRFDVSNDMVRRLAGQRPAHGAESIVVFVAPQDFVYGVLRMFTILGEQTHPNRHVVRTLEEAYRLVGIESPQFRPITIE